jgi:tetratricopeptide (TPR) repeat protein
MKRALVFALLFSIASVAHADTPPSIWDRTKDSNAAAAYELHKDVHSLFAQAREEGRVRRFLPQAVDAGHATLRRAIEKLERFGAEKGRDVRLRFDLGIAYAEIAELEVDRRASYQKAIRILRAALDESPDNPEADDAWWSLAISCGHVGETECEKKSYLAVLRLRTEEEHRATPMLNLAETEMHLGNLREAIDGYRETIRLAGRLQGDQLTAPLAIWGLAIALDRSGDHLGAEREATRAVELEKSSGFRHQGAPKLLQTNGVFFYPHYEIDWYEGLENVSLARAAKTAQEAVVLLKQAEASFSRYVTNAERDKDRWLDLARARLAAAKADREKAEKRAAREPRPVAPPPHREETLTL